MSKDYAKMITRDGQRDLWEGINDIVKDVALIAVAAATGGAGEITEGEATDLVGASKSMPQTDAELQAANRLKETAPNLNQIARNRPGIELKESWYSQQLPGSGRIEKGWDGIRTNTIPRPVFNVNYPGMAQEEAMPIMEGDDIVPQPSPPSISDNSLGFNVPGTNLESAALESAVRDASKTDLGPMAQQPDMTSFKRTVSAQPNRLRQIANHPLVRQLWTWQMIAQLNK